ncbi:transposase [Desulfosarcina alkanivorans]|uniref:transposase n=1 Tax=Desulfosarcina alkanivorans TaxID=571177 RepID=UPI0012D2E99F
MKKRQIDLSCPHRKNRQKPKLQDDCKLRRDRKRWIVERTFSWIENYRRLLVRHENLLSVYKAFSVTGFPYIVGAADCVICAIHIRQTVGTYGALSALGRRM